MAEELKITDRWKRDHGVAFFDEDGTETVYEDAPQAKNGTIEEIEEIDS